MARTAIISDVHANLEALSAVLEDIKGQEADRIFCLGDIIGYNADPIKCLKIVMNKCDVVLKGNHEHYILANDFSDLSPYAEISLRWTRRKLGLDAPKTESFLKIALGMLLDSLGNKRQLYNYMKSLPESFCEGDVLYVHGSPRDSIFEYFGAGEVAVLNPKSLLLPEHIRNLYRNQIMHDADCAPGIRKLETNFNYVNRLCFNGHTHNPCAVIHLGNEQEIDVCGSSVRFYDGKKLCVDEVCKGYACVLPAKVNSRLYLGNLQKAIINVGSVGQPRDGSKEAAYVIYDRGDETVEWRKVSYDNEKAANKSRNAGLRD